jgi:hypothetical protein
MRAESVGGVPATPYLNRASTIALRQLKAVGDDVRFLPLIPRTVVTVFCAQGVVDNGGLRFFFENDWPGQPPYSVFIEAYRRIGCKRASQALAEAVALFPFGRPHRYMERRQTFMDSLPESHPLFHDRVCGDTQVWENLEAYVRLHWPAFWKRLPKLSTTRAL